MNPEAINLLPEPVPVPLRTRMVKSDKTIDLDTALIKAKTQYKPLIKEVTNPYFKSKYADLPAVLAAVEPALHDNGILIASSFETEGNLLTVFTELVHAETGEYRASKATSILKDPTDPQKTGSIITYLKRYAVVTLAGIAADTDDDGNAAADKGMQTTAQKSNRPSVNQTPAQPQVAARPGEKKVEPVVTKVPEKTVSEPEPVPAKPEVADTKDRPRTAEERKAFNLRLREYAKHVESESLRKFAEAKIKGDLAGATFGQWEALISEMDAALEAGTLKTLVESVA